MTENEAIREMTFDEEYEILLKEKDELFSKEDTECETPFANCIIRRALRCIRKALEEIQQYREIGTVKEIKIREAQFARLSEGYLSDLTLLRDYQAIGTLEECRVAAERMKPKKPTYDGDGYSPDGTFVWDEWLCPNCNSRYEVDYDNYDYCPNCGQHLDWSE